MLCSMSQHVSRAMRESMFCQHFKEEVRRIRRDRREYNGDREMVAMTVTHKRMIATTATSCRDEVGNITTNKTQQEYAMKSAIRPQQEAHRVRDKDGNDAA